MYILFADETNMQPSEDAKFFIYGGLIIDSSRLDELHQEVEVIRETYGYEPIDELKFSTRERPDQVSIEDATQAKREVVDLCARLECKFLAYMILHDIIRNQPQDNIIKYAVNSVLGRFEKFLRKNNSSGMVLVDNLPVRSQWSYLSEKFSHGIETSRGMRRLDNIRLLGATCVGASHACSAMDILLGSFRYCSNNPQNRNAAQEMIRNVNRLLWHRVGDGVLHVKEYGLIQRPIRENIRRRDYRQEYRNFILDLNELIMGND